MALSSAGSQIVYSLPYVSTSISHHLSLGISWRVTWLHSFCRESPNLPWGEGGREEREAEAALEDTLNVLNGKKSPEWGWEAQIKTVV